MSACNNYIWNGINYTSSGTYTWVGTNAVGCTATLVLTINSPTTYNKQQIVTHGMELLTQHQVGTNSVGCDSTVFNISDNSSSSSTQ